MMALWLFLGVVVRRTRSFVVPSSSRRGGRAACAAVETSLLEETTLRPPPSYRLKLATGAEDFRAASEVCEGSFPSGTTAAQHLKALENPGSLSNIFFNVAGEASLVLAYSDDEKAIACAQLVPCVIRAEATSDTLMIGKRAFWAQYVCVEESARKCGVAKALMKWCEAEAASAAHFCEEKSADIWLATETENIAALKLYKGIGFHLDGLRRNHVVMRKEIEELKPSKSHEAGPASSYELRENQHKGAAWLPLFVEEIFPRLFGTFFVFGAFAATLAPFAYHQNAFDALRQLFISDSVFFDLGLGVASACFLELLRRLLVEKTTDDIIDELKNDTSLAAQKECLWRLTGGANALESLFVLFLWQSAAVLSEEAYYRGFVLNGSSRVLATVLPPLLASALGLVLSTTLFALAHTSWVNDDNPQRDEQSLAWLKDTAPAGALLGLLFLATDGRILAPIICHLLANVYWCTRNLDALRNAPQDELNSIFDNVRAERRKIKAAAARRSTNF